MPSCTLAQVFMLSAWNPILWKKNVAGLLLSHRSKLNLSEHTNAQRKGLLQLSQCVSVAIITTTKDSTVISFPIKITSGRLVDKNRTEEKGQDKQIPFSHTAPQTSAILSACQPSGNSVAYTLKAVKGDLPTVHE